MQPMPSVRSWVNQVPESLRASTKIAGAYFPEDQPDGVWSEWLNEWRRELRAYHPDVFPIYFRLTVPLGAVRRNEIMALLSLAASPLISVMHSFAPKKKSVLTGCRKRGCFSNA